MTFNLLKKLTVINIVDIAEILENVENHKLLKIFRLLPKDKAADVFSYMSPENQKIIIEAITDKELATIVNDLYLDDTVDLLEELPANVVKKVLKNTDGATRKIINQFLNYPEDSAGSVMTIEYVDLKKISLSKMLSIVSVKLLMRKKLSISVTLLIVIVS